MNIKKIMELAEVQANARVENAKAKIAELEETLQLARDELFYAEYAKNELKLLLAEPVNPQDQSGWSLSQPLLTVYAAHNGAVGMSECWFVVAATKKEDAENLIKEATKGAGIKYLSVRSADIYNNKLDKKAAEKAKVKPNTVFMMKSYRKTLSEV